MFYTDEGWQDAGDLDEGDLLLSLDGEYDAVEAIEVAYRTDTMYDLTVDAVHTFAVGDGQWVVHNTNCFVPKNALGNIGDAAEVGQLNHATLQLYNQDGHTFFSGVYHLDTGRWLAYPSGETRLTSGDIPSIRVNRQGGHRQVWHSWSKFDPFIPPQQGPWNPEMESGLVGFTLGYVFKETIDGYPLRFRSVSINASSWLSQEAPASVQVFSNYLYKPGEWLKPRQQVIDALTGDLNLPLAYITHSFEDG